MAVANIYVYCGEGGWSVEDVNRFADSVSKSRSWESHDGISLSSLTVLTNEPEDSFVTHVKVKPYDFEFEGYYRGVVFPTGNVIVDNVLYVYYGGADKYCCLATAPLDELLTYLKAQPVFV